MYFLGSADVIELARQRVEDVLAAEQLKLTGLKKGWNIGSHVTNNNTINGCYDVAPSFDITEVISIPSNKVTKIEIFIVRNIFQVLVTFTI